MTRSETGSNLPSLSPLDPSLSPSFSEQMSSHRRGPVAEKLQCKEKARRELHRSREEAEAVSKAELDSLKSCVDTIRTNTQQINRY